MTLKSTYINPATIKYRDKLKKKKKKQNKTRLIPRLSNPENLRTGRLTHNFNSLTYNSNETSIPHVLKHERIKH